MYDGFWIAFVAGAVAATALYVFVPAVYGWVRDKINSI